MNKYIITTVFLLSISVSFGQNPWTREKGKSYVQLGFTSLTYDTFQFNGNKTDTSGQISDLTIQAYAEYGLTYKLELLAVIPYKFITIENPSSDSDVLSGMGNISVGFKYKWYDKKWKISSGIVYNAKSIKVDGNIGLSTGFNAATILPFVAVGASSSKWYYFGNVGYGYMNNDYSDYLKATFEVGYEVIQNGHLIFVVDTRNTVAKEAAFKNDTAQWPSYLDRQTYNALGLKANYEFKKDKFGANFAAIGATGIDNAPLVPTFNFGIYTKF